MSIQRELKVARKAKVGSERKAGVDEAGVVMTLLDKVSQPSTASADYSNR